MFYESVLTVKIRYKNKRMQTLRLNSKTKCRVTVAPSEFNLVLPFRRVVASVLIIEGRLELLSIQISILSRTRDLQRD